MTEMNLMPLGEQEYNELLHPLPNTQMRYFVAVTILVSWALLNQ